MSRRVDFERVNRAALANAEAIVRAFLPDGRREGQEYATTGFDRKEAARALHKVGLLDKGEGVHWKKRHSRKGLKLRLWTVKGAILEADLGD
jgi:hypothetical protein